ncbi:transposase family protein [Streptomyces sp. NPDC059629]|uniref:transposase family protein n=1 Tax=Streptomyces sp. NPDC059629 TaxID=3346889 RepID=UPI003682DFD2
MTARTRDDPVPCPACGTPAGRVHGFHGRRVADVPVDGRRVVVSVRLRHLVHAVNLPRQAVTSHHPADSRHLPGAHGPSVKHHDSRPMRRLTTLCPPRAACARPVCGRRESSTLPR